MSGVVGLPKDPPAPDGSPFDKIRRFQTGGGEYWIARELGAELGYAKWERVEDLIKRARQTCVALGNDPADHFEVICASARNSNQGGRPGSDVRMTRCGRYITALCGDSHKKEVAAARHNFAVMSRAQELARQQAQSTPQPPAVASDPIPASCAAVATMRRDQLGMKDSLAATGEQIINLIDVSGNIYDEVIEVRAGLNKVLAKHDEAARDLAKIPKSDQPARPLTTRANIHMRVDAYRKATDMGHEDTWHELHHQMRRRCSYTDRT